MKRGLVVLAVFALLCSIVHAGPLDELLKGVKIPGSTGADDSTTISGLKEALAIGTDKAVFSTSQVNGYFKNQMIKILLPEKIQTAGDILGKIGYQKQVDAFILSMNRAAEKAAPKAKNIFLGAIKQMTITDAGNILRGGDTAATDYFKSKTMDTLYGEFRPVISSAMNQVGVTKSYKAMIGKYTSSVPFASPESLDLDHYVTTKALDGLFYMVAQEEIKIRKDPAARVTELLRTVFGK